MRLFLVLALVWAGACAPAVSGDNGTRGVSDGGGGVDFDAGGQPDAAAAPDGGGAPDAAGVVPPCSVNALPLLVVGSGSSERYYVEVECNAETVALQLDTGSALTFIFTGAGQPDYQPSFAELQVGCQTVTAAGRGYDAPDDTIGGLRVVGLMGMEFLLEQPTVLDVQARLLTRHVSFPVQQTQQPGAVSIAFDRVQDHALVPGQLDGAAVRLIFDTGGGDTLHVGADGQPGDEVVYVQDFEGNVFPIYQGTGVLTFPGLSPATVPVARAPQFPYFEQTVTALGGNLHGLLGVTSFPNQRLLFDGATHRLWAIPSL